MELLTGLGILAIIALIGLGTFLFIFWILMMISALSNKGISETARWIWFGLMLGLAYLYGIGWIVAIVYFFTDRKKR
ncbi:MAG: hypothetical protein US76_01775 [Parcubacteria group bacterium GW2011_GWA2_38_13b]|nr:MAG: hypothetical protein US76_01775 [Parcubacteria group bacterium GW2011_GWA2_38_13b]